MKGAFIVVEGCDGSGKSTLIQSLKKFFESLDQVVLLTKEPLDPKIRERLLTEKLDALEQLQLFMLDRKQHVEGMIRPALEAGQVVLCDRFSPSTIAYQCGGESLDLLMVHSRDAEARGGLWPDMIILLDGDVAVFKKRLVSRGAVLTTYERKSQDYHERVRASFLEQAKVDPDHWVVVDAEKTAREAFADALARLETLFSNLGTP